MESFFSSLKTERIRGGIYRSRDQALADVFDYIERFYNPRRRRSTIGYLSPWNSKRWPRQVKRRVHRTGSRPHRRAGQSLLVSRTPRGLV